MIYSFELLQESNCNSFISPSIAPCHTYSNNNNNYYYKNLSWLENLEKEARWERYSLLGANDG